MKLDLGIPMEEAVSRIVAGGYDEELAKEVVETASVVFEFAMDEPISRRYVAIHLKLLENRAKRRIEEVEARLMSRLDALEELLARVPDN